MNPVEFLYIHIPFCTHICPYCAFHKHTGKGREMSDFLDALLKELEWAKTICKLKPRTVYFGGGTPSAIGLPLLEKFLARWPFRQVEEFTFECNPETVSPEKARMLMQSGVNRVSLGVQSLQEKKLKFLGRKHTREDVFKTTRLLREAGVKSLNIDLIFGLPGETEESWRNDLEGALELHPDHLSCYSLTIESKTPFSQDVSSKKWACDSDHQGTLFLLASEVLTGAGFHHYEVSNYALPGFESIHNRAYWQGKDYLGLGAGACSTIGLRRWRNAEDTKAYVESIFTGGSPLHADEPLSHEIRRKEGLFLALRTSDGVPWEKIVPWEGQFRDLIEEGLAIKMQNRVVLTRQGLAVADTISELFV